MYIFLNYVHELKTILKTKHWKNKQKTLVDCWDHRKHSLFIAHKSAKPPQVQGRRSPMGLWCKGMTDPSPCHQNVPSLLCSDKIHLGSQIAWAENQQLRYVRETGKQRDADLEWSGYLGVISKAPDQSPGLPVRDQLWGLEPGREDAANLELSTCGWRLRMPRGCTQPSPLDSQQTVSRTDPLAVRGPSRLAGKTSSLTHKPWGLEIQKSSKRTHRLTLSDLFSFSWESLLDFRD